VGRQRNITIQNSLVGCETHDYLGLLHAHRKKRTLGEFYARSGEKMHAHKKKRALSEIYARSREKTHAQRKLHLRQWLLLLTNDFRQAKIIPFI
jgi:hypothetical protein